MPSWVFIKNKKIKEFIFIPLNILTLLSNYYYDRGYYNSTYSLFLFSEQPLILEKIFTKFFKTNELIYSASVESIEFLVLFNIKINEENFLNIIKNNKFSNKRIGISSMMMNLKTPVIETNIYYYNYINIYIIIYVFL